MAEVETEAEAEKKEEALEGLKRHVKNLYGVNHSLLKIGGVECSGIPKIVHLFTFTFFSISMTIQFRRLRCCKYDMHFPEAHFWEDLESKIMECIRNTVDRRVQFYEDEIRKLSEQRLMPVWNFCNFFILKVHPFLMNCGPKSTINCSESPTFINFPLQLILGDCGFL
ncbi:hypothetical protein MTR_4g126280 [Medicago truncatula]|uniref:TRAPPC10/Trs130 N-terminal domain-containing protein n=1 Tax=Medicago truncatula TaxID=3880 RepID=A0A072UTW9_MEDTR|nr:hypothetical protein MTR_4g126280 [Medicago truncatula]